MPIRVEHSPSAGAVGLGAFFAGQGNPDDAAKREQLALQRQQMQTDAQLRSQQMATQLYMTQQGHDYDLYSRLAGMDNENQQLQFRTAADMAKQQYGTEADFASQYNQQQNANAQLQYRTEADFASQYNQQQNQRQMQEDSQNFQEGGMRFQADKQAQQQQEEFRLRDELAKNQLDRQEKQRMARLRAGIDNIQQRDDLDPIQKKNLITAMETDLNPLQMMEQNERIIGAKLQNVQRQQQIDAMNEEEKQSVEETTVDRWNPQTGGYDTFIKRGRYSPYTQSGPAPSSGGGTGTSGSTRQPMPKADTPYVHPTQKSIHEDALYMIAGRPGMFVPLPVGASGGGDLTNRELTEAGAIEYQNARATVEAGHKERLQGHLDVLKQQKAEQQQQQQPMTKTTYEMLAPLDKLMVEQSADDQLAKEFPKLSPTSSVYARKKAAMVETITTNVYGKGDSPFIPRDSQMDVMGGAAGGAIKVDPITEDRINGSPGAKPLETVQKKALDDFGRATILAWTIDAPMEVKQTYARDASEGIALFKRYGSVAAMKESSPTDYTRFKAIERQMSDLEARASGTPEREEITVGLQPSFLGGSLFGGVKPVASTRKIPGVQLPATAEEAQRMAEQPPTQSTMQSGQASVDPQIADRVAVFNRLDSAPRHGFAPNLPEWTDKPDVAAAKVREYEWFVDNYYDGGVAAGKWSQAKADQMKRKKLEELSKAQEHIRKLNAVK